MPEEEDQDQLAAAVDQEFSFNHVVSDDFSDVLKPHLKVEDKEEGLEDSKTSASITVKSTADGTIECEKCQGDTSDMVKPFKRLSKKSGSMNVKSFTVPAKTHFWNVKETTQCMKDKYVLLLGDSTIVENLNDMLLLLAGGPKKVDAAKFYQDVTHVPHNGELRFDTPAGEMINTYTARNRNETVVLKGQNLLMRYRFTGAVKLAGNCEGLSVLLDEKVNQEVKSMVENDGRKPDVIIIHSAMHDMCNTQLNKNHLNSFYGSIDKVGKEFIKPWVEQGIKVI